MALYSALVTFAGSLVGTWVARSHFLIPVACLWVATWAYLTYVLYLIAAPVQSSSVVLGILRENWLSIVLSALALVAGWAIGRSITRSSVPVPAA